MFGFGLVGFIMKKFQFPIAPAIIGLVLGDLTEISLRRGMRIVDYDLVSFLSRPIAASILAIALLSLVYTIYSILKRNMGAKKNAAGPRPVE
jgi:putative tricarboxylic transport membrane protein